MEERTTTTAPKLRGFAAMDEQRRRELAQRGGQKAHAIGAARRWTADEARAQSAKAVEARRRKSAQLAAE